jgi:hypothetical protein
MRQQDITDPIDVINFKIAWYQCLADYLIEKSDPQFLQSLVLTFQTCPRNVRDIVGKLIPVLRAEHPLYGNLVGNFVTRKAFEKLDLHDPVLRPAPGKIEICRVEDVSIFYHANTNEYEVSDATIGVRFPALYVPIFGPDFADEQHAMDIAAAIVKSKEQGKPSTAVAERFSLPKLRTSQSLRIEEIVPRQRRNRGH